MSDHVERKFGDLTVRIDRGACIASATCVSVGAEVFELDSEGIVSFRDEGETLPQDELIEACRVCPVDALILIGPDGKQIHPAE